MHKCFPLFLSCTRMCVLDCGLDGPPARLSHLPWSAFEPYQKINWQTAGVGFRTAAQVADGIARSGATDWWQQGP